MWEIGLRKQGCVGLVRTLAFCSPFPVAGRPVELGSRGVKINIQIVLRQHPPFADIVSADCSPDAKDMQPLDQRLLLASRGAIATIQQPQLPPTLDPLSSNTFLIPSVTAKPHSSFSQDFAIEQDNLLVQHTSPSRDSVQLGPNSRGGQRQ
jgi:hypothetical protein